MARVLRSDPIAEPTPVPEPSLEALVQLACDERRLRDGLERLTKLRTEHPGAGPQIDAFLLGRLGRATVGLSNARAVHEELRELIAQLGATPWHPATFLRACETKVGPRALVVYEGTRHLVAVGPDVDLGALEAGDAVYLANERNAIVAHEAAAIRPHGELATFEHWLADGRIALRSQEETAVVDAAAALAAGDLAAGATVLWDRRSGIAYERVDRRASTRHFLTEIPLVTRHQIGGQDAALEAMLSALTVALVDPVRAQRYALGGRQSVLLVGPPGTGKTLLARIAAAELSLLVGKPCRFAVVKPGEFESSFVGATQQRIRECFQALREAAEEGPTVLFLDEIESIGRIRGGSVNQHADLFLTALLAELDGFVGRAGIAVVAATNRKNLLDFALLERLSDVEIVVGRPDMRGARRIFEIHLPETLPFAAESGDAAAARAEVIEAAVTAIYAPNGASQLCTLHLRDGRTRAVHARELASGRTFEQICRAARQQAFLREVHGGAEGLRSEDLLDAVADALARLATSVSPRNAHAHLADLPEDEDVLRVEPVARRVSRPHRFRIVA